ncbi:MAG: tRNA (adenosine(37)-N6)-dimethylallyltransferase MiaA [Candidatus Omnitrophota bacterium]
MNCAGKKPTVIFIVGPTASGKTVLSIKLAAHIRGEIISCDSMQVYRGMEILSQAPAVPERRRVAHHLVGFLSPEKEWSAALFRTKARRLIASAVRRRRVPIVAGGSGLYVKALIDGLFPSPEADPAFRKRMNAAVLKYGSGKLHAELSGIDPDAAARIHPNDARRIIRALEVYRSTGKTMTEMKARTMGLGDKYRIKIFGLTMPRAKLYARINARVEKILADGAVWEVERLRDKDLSKTAKAILGLKEITAFIDGEYDLDTAGELLGRNTRHFAKRQLSWFRADRRIRWFDVSRTPERVIVRKIIKEIKSPVKASTGDLVTL